MRLDDCIRADLTLWFSPVTGQDLSAAWEENAQDWLAWARTPSHDAAFSELNFPALRELLPDPGLATLDVGCGKGRVGRILGDLGHNVYGLDSSPTLAEAARDAGGYKEVVCGDASSLPWEPGSFDLAIAFMCLMDMPDPVSAVREISRVLAPAGRLCIVLTHPLNGTPGFLDDYFTERGFDRTIDAAGISMRFVGRERPIEYYTRALASTGFFIEEFREPRPSDEVVGHNPGLAPAAGRPWSLLIRARLG